MAFVNNNNSFQHGLKGYKGDISNYALFLGGLNTGNAALKQYDPLKTGYARIFFVRMPAFMNEMFPQMTLNARHIFEYGFTRIDGIQNLELNREQITGGYAGRSFEVGTSTTDGTSSLTIGLYEFAGSPIKEFTELWITGIADPITGIGHYHGSTKEYAQYNHTAEAIYVVTDPSGRADGIEYACLITNMMPTSVKKDHFNYQSGEHQIVQTDVEFTASKYESRQINQLAKILVQKQGILSSSIGYISDYNGQTDFETRTTITAPNWDNRYLTNA